MEKYYTKTLINHSSKNTVKINNSLIVNSTKESLIDSN